MIAPPALVFRPIYQPKPWGGRELERVLRRSLPPGQPIGESWELCDLPEAQSIVRDGSLAGRSLAQLREQLGSALLGGAALSDGRFPLLIKYLDARENLSVQVHPSSAAVANPDEPADAALDAAPGIKHECWFVLDAAPGASVYIGLRDGVTAEDLRQSAGTSRVAELLRRWPASRGQFYYLPSGTPHALGAGVVVAEVQTPSDVTYRLYDWDRVGLDGRPRELHIPQALRHARVDVAPADIQPSRSHMAGAFQTVTRLLACQSFLVSRVRTSSGVAQPLPHGEMFVWIVLAGRGAFVRGPARHEFGPGDVVLVPAEQGGTRLEAQDDCDALEVTVPIRSSLAARSPSFEPDAPQGSGPRPVPLGRPRGR